MPEWLKVVLLGIVEGITEFLPVSSTGHLLLAQQWLGARTDLFNTVIQCGTVLAVLLVFMNRLRELAQNWRSPECRRYLLKLTVAFVITGIGGLGLKMAGMTLPDKAAPVAWTLLAGGLLILIVETTAKSRAMTEEVSWTVAVAVGLAQLAAAVFPGLSRSGATILIALALGLKRPAATEFSFLVGIPTLLAAGALQLYSAYSDPESRAEDWVMLLLGAAVATLTAFIAVKWLLHYVQTHTFIPFGWYRIVVGLVILVLLVL